MAPQKQQAVQVTTTDEAKAKSFDNLQHSEADVPQLQDGQVRTFFGRPGGPV